MSLIYPGAFRLIVHPQGEGRQNMAVDHALLRQVENGECSPVLRLYGFSPPALSIGRFQQVKERIKVLMLKQDRISLVRRPTGGQAVLHDQELTYAVILAKEHIQPFSKREIYKFTAGLLLAGLNVLGIRGISNRERKGSLHNPDCFRSSGEYEITGSRGHKLVGSAQVTTRKAALQHGAIPLDDSYQKISCYLKIDGRIEQKAPGCLEDELGRKVSFKEAVQAFTLGFKAALAIEQGELTEAEWKLTGELYRTKYAEDEWNLMY